MRLSVMLSNFGLPFDQAVETAASLGFEAVQLSFGDESIAEQKRRAAAVRAHNMDISAISVDVGDLGDAEAAPARVEAAKPWMDAAAEFGSGICQSHVGIMPHNMSGPRWDSFRRHAAAIAEYGERVGACLALETGPEPARVTEALMRDVNSEGLGVNYDPANFIIWPAVLPKFADLMEMTGSTATEYEIASAMALWEPVEGVKRLGPYIVHAHAKDGAGDGGWADVPLGEGLVDWPRFLQLLGEAGFNGDIAIEREGGSDRLKDIRLAADFMRKHLAQLEAIAA
jgi:sugar phosphate isomerase/epimerase